MLLTSRIHAQLEIQDGDGDFPLHKAASGGHCSVIDVFLQAGANINATSHQDGATALHRAACAARVDAVGRLISAGSDIAAVDKISRTALHWAAWHAHDDIVKQLLRAGADITAQDVNGRTVVNLATWRSHDKTVQELLQGEGHDGRTALLRAASEGQTNLVVVLMEAGADVNQSNDGETALHLAASGGYESVVEKLLLAGADPSKQSVDGATPLHRAAWRGHYRIVDLLLQNGSSVAIKNNENWTPLHHSAYAGHQKVMAILLSQCDNIWEGKDSVKFDFNDHLNTDVLQLLDSLISAYPHDTVFRRALGNEFLRRKLYSQARDAFDQYVRILIQNQGITTIGNIQHCGIHCDECSKLVQGKQYKCIICSWNYDLCEPCGLSHSHSSRDLIQIPSERFCQSIPGTNNVCYSVTYVQGSPQL